MPFFAAGIDSWLFILCYRKKSKLMPFFFSTLVISCLCWLVVILLKQNELKKQDSILVLYKYYLSY